MNLTEKYSRVINKPFIFEIVPNGNFFNISIYKWFHDSRKHIFHDNLNHNSYVDMLNEPVNALDDILSDTTKERNLHVVLKESGIKYETAIRTIYDVASPDILFLRSSDAENFCKILKEILNL